MAPDRLTRKKTDEYSSNIVVPWLVFGWNVIKKVEVGGNLNPVHREWVVSCRSTLEVLFWASNVWNQCEPHLPSSPVGDHHNKSKCGEWNSSRRRRAERRDTKNNKDPKFRCLWYSMISWSQTFAILPPPLFHGSLRQEAKTSVARRHNLFRRMLWRAPFGPDLTALEKVYEARDPTIWGVAFCAKNSRTKISTNIKAFKLMLEFSPTSSIQLPTSKQTGSH